MATEYKQILTDLSPILKYYTDGTVERLFGSPHVPTSPEDPDTGVSSKDIFTIPPGISARIYIPKRTTQKLPILIYFHGGGFCVESAFSALDHRYMNLLCAASKALIISVEYRLAPENPLPAAYEDSWNSFNWVCSHNTDKTDPNFVQEPWLVSHGDFSRIFIGGDSAGGNIAHNIAMRAGAESSPGNSKLLGALLSHPFFWSTNPIGSEPREAIEQSLPYRIWSFVFPSAENGIDNPMINPFADGAPSLSNLGCSKLLVCVAEKDVLTGRAIEYVKRVKTSGWNGEVAVVEIEGEDHCFHIFNPETDKAKSLINSMASFISQRIDE